MKFCIETENLAIDTVEVSDHFYKLCKQRAEQGYQEWSSNQIWESPERDVLVIAVIESGHEIADLAKKLEVAWSVDVDVLEKIEQLDDVLKWDNKVVLIKIYRATANVSYNIAKKKDSFCTTERAAYYKKLHEDASRRKNNAELREISCRENLEEIPHIPKYWFYELELIKGYRCLEVHATLSNEQGDSDMTPTEEDNPPLKKTRGIPDLTDPKVQCKVYAWLRDNEPTLPDEDKIICKWLVQRMKGEGWIDIARNPEYETQRKGKKHRAFSRDIQYKTETLLVEKIMKDSSANT